MKNKLLITVLLTASLIPSLVQAFGNQNEWVSGWGQGVSEYSILGKGKSRYTWLVKIQVIAQKCSSLRMLMVTLLVQIPMKS